MYICPFYLYLKCFNFCFGTACVWTAIQAVCCQGAFPKVHCETETVWTYANGKILF